MPEHTQDTIDRIRHEAVALAGRPQDLVQRASVYLHLFRHSGQRHVFPLMAAHGALWGAGHFRRGLMIGSVIARVSPDGAAKLQRLEAFATAFKEINRQVCVEAYSAYHITGRLGAQAALDAGIDAALTRTLIKCHDARRAGREFSARERAELFSAFFNWEQDNVVQKSVDAAVAELDWPLMREIALRPPVWFKYFRKPMLFKQFDSKAERIEKGVRAYELGEARGWSGVEADIARYGLMPEPFINAPDTHFASMLKGLNLRPLMAA